MYFMDIADISDDCLVIGNPHYTLNVNVGRRLNLSDELERDLNI